MSNKKSILKNKWPSLSVHLLGNWANTNLQGTGKSDTLPETKSKRPLKIGAPLEIWRFLHIILDQSTIMKYELVTLIYQNSRIFFWHFFSLLNYALSPTIMVKSHKITLNEHSIHETGYIYLLISSHKNTLLNISFLPNGSLTSVPHHDGISQAVQCWVSPTKAPYTRHLPHSWTVMQWTPQGHDAPDFTQGMTGSKRMAVAKRREAPILQESYNTPLEHTAHPRQSPYPTMKGFPLQPIGKGLGVCSKGVLKQP